MGKAEGTIESYLMTQAKKNDFLCEKFISNDSQMCNFIMEGEEE